VISCAKPGFDLYLITEGTLGADSDKRRIKQFFERIEEALKGGATAIQLREKGLSTRRMLQVALELRELTGRYGALLFINDRVDVALISGADGVHLPSSGLNAEEVRVLFDSGGKDLLVGVSTHSLKEAQDAERACVDFITFGPVFFTRSKASYGEPVGVTRLAEVVRGVNLPVFALGGIDKENLAEVMETGVHGAAMISAILGEEDISRSAAMVTEELRK
jgi:thiamine-phosphate pyrophosphorylase